MDVRGSDQDVSFAVPTNGLASCLWCVQGVGARERGSLGTFGNLRVFTCYYMVCDAIAHLSRQARGVRAVRLPSLFYKCAR